MYLYIGMGILKIIDVQGYLRIHRYDSLKYIFKFCVYCGVPVFFNIFGRRNAIM